MKKLICVALFLVNFQLAVAQQAETAYLFFENLITSNYKAAYGLLSPKLKQKIADEAVLAQLWNSVQFELGAYKDTTESLVESVDSVMHVFIGCTFQKKGNLDIFLQINRQNTIESFLVKPEKTKKIYVFPKYHKPENYVKTYFNVANKKWTLFGNLHQSSVKSPSKTLVILGHGSGPGNRDGEIGVNKMFRDIAIGLANYGISTYSFDKRTFTYPNETFLQSDSFTVWDETIADVLAVADSFKKSGLYDRIVFAGHSLSANQAPRIAKHHKFDGVVMLAGNVTPLDSVVLYQIGFLGKLNKTENLEDIMADMLEKIDFLRNGKPDKYSSLSALPLPVCAAWWLDMIKYNPVETALETETPMLILQGKEDYQVTTAEFQKWKNGLKNRPKTYFKTFNDLNHAFMPGKKKNGPKSYDMNANVPKHVIKVIADFVKAIE
jgi:dienelactone hydrolase